jgi:glycosyltransferase involved in cell wall biosynthesis
MTTRSKLPTVSIVIPARNEIGTIGVTLESCLAQAYAGDIEIIVSDAMSEDGTRVVLDEYEAEYAIQIVDNPAKVTSAGLNTAIAASSGEVIIRCDAHAVLPDTYVEDAVRILTETAAGNVGGIQRAVGSTPVQRGIAAAMTNPLGVGDAKFHRGGKAGPTDTVYLGAFPRDVLDALGGYDESLVRNQDYELNVRIRDAGYAVWFDPLLEVVYTPRSTLRALWHQYGDYGRWKRQVISKHPSSLKLRQAGPPALVIGLSISAVSLITPLRKVGAAALLGYATALSSASLYEASRTRDRAALLAGPAIGIMHIAWGLGFLTGRTSRR